jgi:hypothetical protein
MFPSDVCALALSRLHVIKYLDGFHEKQAASFSLDKSFIPSSEVERPIDVQEDVKFTRAHSSAPVAWDPFRDINTTA